MTVDRRDQERFRLQRNHVRHAFDQQHSRASLGNLFRGMPGAFAADPLARRLSRCAISQGCDTAMAAQERLFLYIPLEHSEERADQALAVQLIASVGNAEWTRFAIAHKEIIDRFGRFPHRNAILNRNSSADELALLQVIQGHTGVRSRTEAAVRYLHAKSD